MAVSYDRAQIRAALALNDPAISCYLDLESGTVVQIDFVAVLHEARRRSGRVGRASHLPTTPDPDNE